MAAGHVILPHFEQTNMPSNAGFLAHCVLCQYPIYACIGRYSIEVRTLLAARAKKGSLSKLQIETPDS
ncbi:hypothetical protein N431DRAFT_435033 [Stipitochalara longipes BDJ]|nr:hypothetical protein N431DRAFT_435033 [Stipitochalara longipes BDJ]